MLPHIHRATQKFYIFLIVYLTGCTPLQYFGDFSQKEIAAMLKITPGNVKVLSYRAKKELKEYLTKEEGR